MSNGFQRAMRIECADRVGHATAERTWKGRNLQVRFTQRFEADGRAFLETSEMSEDGQTWLPLAETRFTKAGKGNRRGNSGTSCSAVWGRRAVPGRRFRRSVGFVRWLAVGGIVGLPPGFDACPGPAGFPGTRLGGMVFLALALAAMVAGVGCGDPGTGSAGDTGGKDALSDRDSTATDDLDGRDAAGDAAEGAVAGATWTDPATGLTWQKDPGDVEGAWEAAVAHCSGLLDGAGWRLPDIDELRSLIRGCPDTITGGPCRESVQCSSAGTDCYDGEACMGCLDGGGPGKGGCFWPPELDGPCEWYWSSTTEADFPGYACFAHFRAAHLSHDDKRNDWGHHAICVR